MAKMMKPGSQGLSSNKLVRPPVTTGSPSKGITPAHAAQIGTALGDHTTEGKSTGYRGDQMYTKALQTPKYGNEIALNSKSAPGQGRTIHRTGTQSTHGPVDPGNRTVLGADSLSPWHGSNNAARRSPVKR